MHFIVDAQLPPALARRLRELGHDAKHVEDLGLRHAEDGDIWNYALKNHAAIITKDEDFAYRLSQAKVAPIIVWLRVKNVSRQALLAWFEPMIPKIEHLIAGGELLIEVR
jgi:predicted nuclease of predicted toxin-antitoxin system